MLVPNLENYREYDQDHSKEQFLNQDQSINSLLHDKILAWSNFNKFADDEMKVAQMVKFVLDGIGNIYIGKGKKNPGYQHFSFPHNVFKKPSFTWL